MSNYSNTCKLMGFFSINIYIIWILELFSSIHFPQNMCRFEESLLTTFYSLGVFKSPKSRVLRLCLNIGVLVLVKLPPCSRDNQAFPWPLSSLQRSLQRYFISPTTTSLPHRLLLGVFNNSFLNPPCNLLCVDLVDASFQTPLYGGYTQLPSQCFVKHSLSCHEFSFV